MNKLAVLLLAAPAVYAGGNGNGNGNGNSGGDGGTTGNKAPATCIASEVIPNPEPDWLPSGPRCCIGEFDEGAKWGQCDTSSCPNNFGAKNRNCHNFGSPQFPSVDVPEKPAGSALCPYVEADQAICDVSYFTAYNDKSCRNNPNPNSGKNHCLGRVKCGSTGIIGRHEENANGKKNSASEGTDAEGLANPALAENDAYYGTCGSRANGMGLPAGSICFYDGNSDNWKVCEDVGRPDPNDPEVKVCVEEGAGTYTMVQIAQSLAEGEAKPGDVIEIDGSYYELLNNCNLKKTTAPEDKTITPPTENKGSGSGDPHFKTWTGEKYDYHGECDLVLVDNPTFMDGLGLRVHIRTTRIKYFSYIEKIAVQIGQDILEFDNDVENFYINGMLAEPNQKHHKTMLGGFVVRRDPKTLSIRLHELHRHHNKGRAAKIDLHTRKSGFPAIFVDGGETDIFKGSLGLLGEWGSGKKLARDGATEFTDDHDGFALEWQVRDTEPMLFQEARYPQYPQTCLPPAAMGSRLGWSKMQKEAEEACAHWKEDMEDCIFDVIATQDVMVAEEGHIIHIN